MMARGQAFAAGDTFAVIDLDENFSVHFSRNVRLVDRAAPYAAVAAHAFITIICNYFSHMQTPHI
jgi:hypothetical protein